MPAHRILFVDDEPNTLSSFRRIFFREEDIEVFTARSAGDALKILEYNDISLVISDMKMPGVDGNNFLKYTKDKYPQMLRIMITAYADLQATLDAVNNGEVYRFLTKPWNDNDLRVTILKALEYSDLKKRNEEMSKIIWKKNRELTRLNQNLAETVKSKTAQLENAVEQLKKVNTVFKRNFEESINLLTGIISLFKKDLAAHSKRVAILADSLCDALKIEKEEKDTIVYAALLHDIGLLTTVGEAKYFDTEKSDEEHKKQYVYHPILGEKIIGSMSALKGIASLIRSHHEEYNGTGFPDRLRNGHIPRGSQVIKICSDYDELIFDQGIRPDEAIQEIKDNSYRSYDLNLVEKFIPILSKSTVPQHSPVKRVMVKDLQPGMYLMDEIYLENGVLLIPRGVIIDKPTKKRLDTFSTLLRQDRMVEIKSMNHQT
ncbi:MAG: HD domain-containing phosphohydrolase [Spirochaetota bacterium]